MRSKGAPETTGIHTETRSVIYKEKYYMVTIEGLKQYGADVESGLKRCMNNEGFYLKLVQKAVDECEGMYGKLEAALAAGNMDAAFEAAHAMKGVTGNLSLTPLYEYVVEITEPLRHRSEEDQTENLSQIRKNLDELAKLCKD